MIEKGKRNSSNKSVLEFTRIAVEEGCTFVLFLRARHLARVVRGGVAHYPLSSGAGKNP